VSWVRVDCDVPTDERLLCTGFALYWPAVLIRAKKNAGHLPALAASPAQLAHLWGSTVEEWTRAIEHFVRVGLLIERADGDGYDVEEWKRTQLDPTNADRQKRHRNAARNATVTESTVTPPLRVTESTVTPDDADRYNSTVQDTTVHDRTVAADAATTRAHAPAREEAAAATTTPKIDDQFSRVAERWRLALRGKTGAAPLVVGALDIDALSAAVAERGADYVMKCIDRSAEVAGGGGPSLSLLRMILRDGVHEPKPTKSGQSRSKSDKPNDHDPKRVNDAWKDVPDQGYTF
jgi:hypothetical protein